MPSKTARRMGSDSRGRTAPTRKSLPKPKNRPTQAQERAKFTIQAVYDAFVRICRRDGLSAVTMKDVAAEAGYAVGTLYDYFPDKRALFSGYVRYTLDDMLSRIDREVIADGGADDAAPYFDRDMLKHVSAIAEDKHHKRVFEELTAKWREAVGAWQDMPGRTSPETIGALALALWASRRYVLLVGPAAEKTAWVAQLELICRRALVPGWHDGAPTRQFSSH
jgi:AcrR family transcriptional regulator